MEYDLLFRQHDQLVQRAQELASASETLATSIARNEAAIPATSAYELLTNLMDTGMALSRTAEGLRVRLVASLCSTENIVRGADFVTSEARKSEESKLIADEAILGATVSLEVAERCLSAARTALARQDVGPVR